MSFFTSLRNPLGDKMNLGQITKDGKRERKKKSQQRGTVREWRERRIGDVVEVVVVGENRKRTDGEWERE